MDHFLVAWVPETDKEQNSMMVRFRISVAVSILVLLAAVLVGCGTAATAPTPTPALPAATLESEPVERGKLELLQITSQALAGNAIGDPVMRSFHIYLPPGYETSDRRYPVVYALHGYMSNSANLTTMGSVLDSLVASGDAREMILVFPDGSNRFRGSQYWNSPTIGDYESYIARELVAHIDANYRTIPERESRGITGCSMGADGALHLALKYPGVFSVAAPFSGGYDFEHEGMWEEARKAFRREPDDFDDLYQLLPAVQVYFARAAAAAPNQDKPPFYLDMPFEVLDGEGQIVAEVQEKIIAMDRRQDVRDYLAQPERLRGLLIYHGAQDSLSSVEVTRGFCEMLTEQSVEHECVEVDGGHCDFDTAPILKFISDKLK